MTSSSTARAPPYEQQSPGFRIGHDVLVAAGFRLPPLDVQRSFRRISEHSYKLPRHEAALCMTSQPSGCLTQPPSHTPCMALWI